MRKPALPRMLTTTEVAQRLGVKASKILTWIRAGELEAVNVATNQSSRPRFRISVEALQTFEQRRAVQPAPKQPRRYKRPKSKNFVEYIT